MGTRDPKCIFPDQRAQKLVTQSFTYPEGGKLREFDRSKTWIVLPAYNAEKTLQVTVADIPAEFQGRVLLVDDASTDGTASLARRLGLKVIVHDKNLGYGANQKTCYKSALELGADIVVMLHPDNQYDSRVVGIMSDLISLGNADVVIGNRIRNRKDALSGGMPKWKYIINRLSTLLENVLLGQTIGDFHSGLRAYSRNVLETIPFERNNNAFGFDQEFLIQVSAFGFRTGEIPVPTRYGSDASSINVMASLRYGTVTISCLTKFLFYRSRIFRPKIFDARSTT